MASAPDRLDLKRHRHLEGLYGAGLVVRRAFYVVLAAVLVLALVNVFGQRPSTATRDAPAARLQVYAPSHLRGGLLYMARFHILAKQDLKAATLVLAPGWAESITINTIAPSPVDETSDNGKLSFNLGPLQKGRSYILFMEFQVNPTNIGRRSPGTP